MIPYPEVLDRYVVVEQLNASQWHATYGGAPEGDERASGVENWAGAVAEALWMAYFSTAPRGVMSIDLDGNQLELLKPGGGK